MSKQIISDSEILSGTPVFAGTRISLEHVAGLIRRGVPETELAEDFPSLNSDDFAFARDHAERHGAPEGTLKPLKLRRKTKAA
jgi:uncharacterized protein (DUF433 family)